MHRFCLGMNYFSLTPPDLACYFSCMKNRHDASSSPLPRPKSGATQSHAKTFLTERNYPWGPSLPKTTSNGMNWSFHYLIVRSFPVAVCPRTAARGAYFAKVQQCDPTQNPSQP